MKLVIGLFYLEKSVNEKLNFTYFNNLHKS